MYEYQKVLSNDVHTKTYLYAKHLSLDLKCFKEATKSIRRQPRYIENIEEKKPV